MGTISGIENYIRISTTELNKLLHAAVSGDKIDTSSVGEAVMNIEIEKVLKTHPNKIYKGKDGRWYTYVFDETKNHRRKIAKPTKEKLHKALYQYYRGGSYYDVDKITLNNFYPKWKKYKELHTTAGTYISRIECDWKKYYCGTDIVNVPLEKLSKIMLDEWAHSLIKEYSMTKKQYYNCTVIMRQALQYAVDLKIIPENPMMKVHIDGRRMFRYVRKKKDNTQVFSKDELRQLKHLAWKDFHNRTLVYELVPLAILFQFETGLRVGELIAIQDDDIEGDQLHVQRMYRKETKEIVEHTKGSYGDRYVILTSAAKHIIECAQSHRQKYGSNKNGYIFSMDEKPFSYNSISHRYNKYCDIIGTIRKNSHKARKTYISSLIDGNVNINTVREMAGHADERTTYENYCFDRSSNAEKVQLIENALN